MSNCIQNAKEGLRDREELLRLGKMCRELKKEKDMLQVSLSREQSINAELIRKFESDVTAVSETHSKDKYIEELESKMGNCLQEIGFLQDQLNLRNTEVNYLGEHVHSLELKLGEVEKLRENLRALRDDALQSDSRCAFLMHELEKKESNLWKSNMHIEKLEAVISAISLESQCEIESMKLEMASLEQRCFEAESRCDQATQEESRIGTLLEEYVCQIEVAQQTIRSLETDNKDLQEKLRVSEESTRMLVQKAQEYLTGWMNSIHGTMTHAPRESDRCLLMKQVLKEQRKSLTFLKHFHEAQDKAEARSREVHHLKNELKALEHITEEPEVSLSTESCSCGTCVFAR